MYRVGQSYFYPEVTTMIHGKNTYTTLLYEVIYTTYMWGLRGRYFSTSLPLKIVPILSQKEKNSLETIHFQERKCYQYPNHPMDIFAEDVSWKGKRKQAVL